MSALILLLSALFLYARFVEPRRLQLQRVPLRLPQLTNGIRRPAHRPRQRPASRRLADAGAPGWLAGAHQ